MSLSPDQRASFTKVIDSILAASDIHTISSKRIRQRLQATVDYDLRLYKTAVKALIMERFDIFMHKKGVEWMPPEDVIPSTEVVNGHSHTQETSSPSPPPIPSPQRKREAESVASDETEPKKQRPDHDIDADAEFAAKLQAEENKRARPTRGSATRKVASAKKKSKSKTARKVRAEDDSDLDSASEAGPRKEVNRSGGFHVRESPPLMRWNLLLTDQKPLNLSPALSELLDGEVALSRPQTVKKVWDYIKENSLQDPADRRQIRCDARMRPVFKQDRVHMFTMTKILNQHLYDPGE